MGCGSICYSPSVIMKRYLLADCNNFFVSCERIFNPKLLRKPVVVLSSNDACVIARSNEAKALGIPMGIPAFKCKQIFQNHDVKILSANFTLYGDISSRVMQTLGELSSDIEIYSIDEAFLFIKEPIKDNNFLDTYYTEYAKYILKKVNQYTGIPISIGIGSTKTLAKIANTIAKKNPHYKGAFDICAAPNIDEVLESFPIEDIWGIGSKYSKILKAYGIYNARDLKYSNESWIREKCTINGLKTVLELRGIACLNLYDIPKKRKTLCVSRSFGKQVTSIQEIKEALATYISTAAEKLRAQQYIAYTITVFLLSNRYCENDFYYNSTSITLPVATAYTPELIKSGFTCLESIFKIGYQYRKVGVILSNFASTEQLHLYYTVSNSTKKNNVIKSIDRINSKLGKNKIFFAASGIAKPWKTKQLNKSQCYTTNWHEILTINLKN